jgi:lysozyme|tara:strand:- start:2588 stop:3031 length:444 start_codon:yes stop_codon:yes gene_type:complete
MKINETGLNLIKTFEGFRSEPYFCSAMVATIGYGSTWSFDGSRVTLSHPSIDETEAEELLLREIRNSERAIDRLIQIELNENEFSALCSFVYNLGSGNLQSSTLRAKLNRSDYEGAANEFPKWRRAGGKVLKGLVLRRKMEKNLFLT